MNSNCPLYHRQLLLSIFALLCDTSLESSLSQAVVVVDFCSPVRHIAGKHCRYLYHCYIQSVHSSVARLRLHDWLC